MTIYDNYQLDQLLHWAGEFSQDHRHYAQQQLDASDPLGAERYLARLQTDRYWVQQLSIAALDLPEGPYQSRLATFRPDHPDRNVTEATARTLLRWAQRPGWQLPAAPTTSSTHHCASCGQPRTLLAHCATCGRPYPPTGDEYIEVRGPVSTLPSPPPPPPTSERSGVTRAATASPPPPPLGDSSSKLLPPTPAQETDVAVDISRVADAATAARSRLRQLHVLLGMFVVLTVWYSIDTAQRQARVSGLSPEEFFEIPWNEIDRSATIVLLIVLSTFVLAVGFWRWYAAAARVNVALGASLHRSIRRTVVWGSIPFVAYPFVAGALGNLHRGLRELSSWMHRRTDPKAGIPMSQIVFNGALLFAGMFFIWSNSASGDALALLVAAETYDQVLPAMQQHARSLRGVQIQAFSSVIAVSALVRSIALITRVQTDLLGEAEQASNDH